MKSILRLRIVPELQTNIHFPDFYGDQGISSSPEEAQGSAAWRSGVRQGRAGVIDVATFYG